MPFGALPVVPLALPDGVVERVADRVQEVEVQPAHLARDDGAVPPQALQELVVAGAQRRAELPVVVQAVLGGVAADGVRAVIVVPAALVRPLEEPQLVEGLRLAALAAPQRPYRDAFDTEQEQPTPLIGTYLRLRWSLPGMMTLYASEAPARPEPLRFLYSSMDLSSMAGHSG